MTEAKMYPVAEEFSSIQGEGCYTGTPMRFIRLAGCTVGEYRGPDDTEKLVRVGDPDFHIVHPPGRMAKHSVCTSTFGEEFICDTDYRMRYKKSVAELLEGVKEEHICLTGGEPFMHPVEEFLSACLDRGKMLHVETSGTIDMNPTFKNLEMIPHWITCSPKKGFVRANVPLVAEWKFVVGLDFCTHWVEEFFQYSGGRAAWNHPTKPVFLQPVQFVDRVDRKAVERVLRILAEHPGWRLSCQMHKWLELR